ncbi:MAG: TetR/AcrR family transcriptional regulator [Bacteroidota bacterium]
MRPQKVNDETLMNGLLEVLRHKGYEGASLQELSQATGLKKASLYHRFPGGKKEIVEAVMQEVQSWLKKEVQAVLKHKKIKPQDRLEIVLGKIEEFYSWGEKPCILRSLSLGSGIEQVGHLIQASMETWQKGFIKLGQDVGMSKKKAEKKAMESLILIQGALVVSQGSNSPKVFEYALIRIREIYA